MTMKTTFDLPESLVHDVKRIAKERGTTAREIVRQALTRIVDEESRAQPFELADMSVHAEVSDLLLALSPAELRDLAYGERGLA